MKPITLRGQCGYMARKLKTRKPKTCPECNEVFIPAKQGIGWQKYCSVKCYRATARQMLEVVCGQCGAKFKRTRAAIERTKRPVCSPECSRIQNSGNGSRRFRGGHDNDRGSGWVKLAESIRVRDGHICQRCGKTQEENVRRLCVDHVIPWRLFTDKAEANDPKNLISLCTSCHSHKTAGAEEKYLRGDVLDFKKYQAAISMKSAVRKEA